MYRQRTVIVVAVGLSLTALAGSFALARLGPLRPLDPRDSRTTLTHVEDAVAKRCRVEEVITRDLEDLLDETGTVLFDVRTAEEFDLGHLPGAVRVEPGMAIDAFLRAHGSRISGKAVIFYCSVGVRSSEMAARVQSATRLLAPIGQFNLRGGAFRWVVDGRDLVKDDRPGRLHPYSTDWGKLLARTLAAK